jgi:3-hydroxybutyryl-CoA dehydrogenase
MKVAILGVGLMGSQIGCEYALGGHDVTLVARDPERAAARIENAIEVAAEFHIAPQDDLAAAVSRQHVISSVEEGDSQTDLVVESVVEDFALKVDVLKSAARAFPTATIASNTSSLSITQLGEAAGAAERTLGTHYWNPPLLLPLVEVTAGEHTEPERIERMVDTLTKLGKRPVRVEKDVPGFVWNRLQLALLREALWIVENGVASPAVVDETVRYGLARRWRLTGPFETVALGGVHTFSAVAANLFPHLSTATAADGLDALVITDQAVLAEMRERRDQELASELERDRAERAG